MNTILLSILMDVFFITILLWCSYTDLKSRTISNKSILILLCIGIANIGLMVFKQSIWWVYPTGLVFAIPFFITWLKNGMGAGDVKLVMAISLYLGIINTVFVFVLMIPVVIALSIISWIKKRTLKSSIPLAPILSFGAIGVLILGYL